MVLLCFSFYCMSQPSTPGSTLLPKPLNDCCSVAQSCLTFCSPMDCSTPGFPVIHCLPELAQTHIHWRVMPSNHHILCHPLLLLPSIFPCIKVFSNESALHIWWPKYWSFSFSISPSNECCVLCLVAQSCQTPCNPMDCSPPGSSIHGDSPGKNTGMGCHALLQGIFPTQGLNPGLPHYKQILYHLSHQGSLRILEWVAYPFLIGSS